MFYLSKNTLHNTCHLLVNATDKLQLISNIKDAFVNIDTKKIVDEDTKVLIESIKKFSHDIYEKNIRDSKLARMYFEQCSLPEDVKSIVLNNNKFELSDQLVDSYTSFYAKAKYQEKLTKEVESLQEQMARFEFSGIDDVQEVSTKLIETVERLKGLTDGVSKDSTRKDSFVVSMNEEGEDDFGMLELEQELEEAEKNRIKTGNFFDNITGGGFSPGCFYLLASKPGGFKSGTLHNIVEEISCNADVEQMKIPTGMIPCILYINLEMSKRQIINRRISFYKANSDAIYYGGGQEDPPTLAGRIRKMIKEGGSKVEVVFHQAEAKEYTSAKLKSDILDLEKKGRKVILVVTDYLDLFKYEPSPEDEYEKELPITTKAFKHRALAKELNIPIISGAQLNKEGGRAISEHLHKAEHEDIVRRMEGDHLAKGYAVNTIPEQVYMMFRYPIDGEEDEYFGIVVDKDREGVARYISKDGKDETKEKASKGKRKVDGRVYYLVKTDGYRIGNNYARTIRDFIKDDTADEIAAMTIDKSEI